MNDTNFIKALYLSSVVLVELDNNGNPIDAASGTLIDYRGHRILLTVEHATGNQGKWAIQLRYNPGLGTETYFLGAMNFLKKENLYNGKEEIIDFSYVEVPKRLNASRQEIDERSLGIIKEEAINVHTLNFVAPPKKEENYGFCGMVKHAIEPHPHVTVFSGDVTVYYALEYSREEDELYYFNLPFDHPGGEYFKGCSGAPMLDSELNVVGLVCKGYEETSEICVVPIKAYKMALDSLIDDLESTV